MLIKNNLRGTSSQGLCALELVGFTAVLAWAAWSPLGFAVLQEDKELGDLKVAKSSFSEGPGVLQWESEGAEQTSVLPVTTQDSAIQPKNPGGKGLVKKIRIKKIYIYICKKTPYYLRWAGNPVPVGCEEYFLCGRFEEMRNVEGAAFSICFVRS